ncbi:MAG: hypothetical protein JJU35_11495 [Balneolales bacterium]|nr:hypothetical protein [Balneolales bacterium]
MIPNLFISALPLLLALLFQPGPNEKTQPESTAASVSQPVCLLQSYTDGDIRQGGLRTISMAYDAQNRIIRQMGDDGSIAEISWSGGDISTVNLTVEGELIMQTRFSYQGSDILVEIAEEGDLVMRLEMSRDAQGRVTEAREYEYEAGEWTLYASETYVWDGNNIASSQTVIRPGHRREEVWINTYTYDTHPNAFGGMAYGIIMLASGAIGEGFAGYASANNLIAYRQRSVDGLADIRDQAAALTGVGADWDLTEWDITYDANGYIQWLVDPDSGMTRDFTWRCN